VDEHASVLDVFRNEVRVATIDEGFEWGAAAAGAGGAAAVLLLTGAGATTLSRRHQRLRRALGA
jgi:hypothetical protein